MSRPSASVIAGAAGVLVSAYVHFYLYFEGGYRGIHPERFAGIDISRSFALNAIAGLLIAELLVVSLRVPRLARVAALGGMAFAAAALLGYLLSRTTGLLGFTEHQTTVEAVVAKLAELTAIVALPLSLRPKRETERRLAADPA
jgi:hypothetical protein